MVYFWPTLVGFWGRSGVIVVAFSFSTSSLNFQIACDAFLCRYCSCLPPNPTSPPGQVLFIDEVHMLDIECFAFLNRALESPLVCTGGSYGGTV